MTMVFLGFWGLTFLAVVLGFVNCNESTSHEYQFLKRKNNYESQRRRSNDHHLSQPNIKENEYLSNMNNEKRNNNNNMFNNNNFGEIGYQCSGNCYCDERKTSTKVISKGITYFLFSLSTFLAYQKAKTYFESKCIEELSEECHLSSIKSSVEECVENKKETSSSDKEKEEKRIYTCYGNCVPKKFKKRESTYEHFDHLKCKKLKREGEITIYESDLIRKSKSPSRNFRTTARNKFAEYYLIEFCKENSKFDYEYSGIQKYNGKNYPRKLTLTASGCVGREFSALKNIKCKQIIPIPTNYNWLWRLDKFNKEKAEWQKM